MNDERISNQIAVYKTSNKLIEFTDKLKMAEINNYAKIHACGEDKINNIKQYSLIGIAINDYSKGKGDNCVYVRANISPENAKYLYYLVSNNIYDEPFIEDKIFGESDEKGESQVTKLRITYQEKDKKGEIRKYPWFIGIQNGKGIKEKNKDGNGGFHIKEGTFRCERMSYIYINRHDFFIKLEKVKTFINCWESISAQMLLSEKFASDVN